MTARALIEHRVRVPIHSPSPIFVGMYSQTIQQLLALQEVDSQLYALQREQATIPDEEQRLKAPMTEALALVEAAEAELAQLVADQKDLRRALRGAKRNLADCEAEFATVASDEEYESKQRDLQSLRDDITDLEDQLLRLQEEKGDAAAAVAEATETARSHTNAYNDRAAALVANAATIDQEIRRLEVQHAELSVDVEETALALYRRTRGRRGIRIAAVKRGACGGCHTHFPPQTLSEIRHATAVRTCVNCGCITIWDEATS